MNKFKSNRKKGGLEVRKEFEFSGIRQINSKLAAGSMLFIFDFHKTLTSKNGKKLRPGIELLATFGQIEHVEIAFWSSGMVHNLKEPFDRIQTLLLENGFFCY